MTLRVVGAGLGRTGTNSLKLALERLLGEPCYHMIEVFGHPEHIPMWHAAADGERVDWDALFTGYAAAVDWPVASFWRELADEYPDAVVVLSTRTSADAWWRSADDTIFAHMRNDPVDPPGLEGWRAMVDAAVAGRYPGVPGDEEKAKASYEAHNAEVRATIPAERLVDWQAGDGWEPLCRALGVAVPDEPFPHVNTTADFRKMSGLDG
ncbi:MAG TPA: sulfotransferase [Acidimicrobiales bacterium]|jgi:hypothetical protein|nr:sulfotransferase [Acidimicrobiales bacterium]